MYYRIPNFIPIQLQTVATFAAADPWNRSAPAQWTLSVYRMTAEGNQQLYASYSAEKQREVADGQNLDAEDVLGIRSSLDGLYHILPVALRRMWQQGRVSTVQLPGLIAAVETGLERRDFFDPVATQPWRRYMAYGVGALGGVLALLGFWTALTGPHTGTLAELDAWFWFMLAIICGVFMGVLLLLMAARQRRVATQEARIAALLAGGAGVLPGQPA